MEKKADNKQSEKTEPGFKSFAAKRIIASAVIIIVVVWALGTGLDIFSRKYRSSDDVPPQQTMAAEEIPEQGAAQPEAGAEDMAAATRPESDSGPQAVDAPEAGEDTGISQVQGGNGAESENVASPPHPESEQAASVHAPAAPAPVQAPATAQPPAKAPATVPAAETTSHARPPEIQAHPAEPTVERAVRPRGVSFVEALIQPIDYELNKRFWGWRPNDIVNFTDNTNNFQLGVLEVTRRTAIMLSDRISRTGSTDRLNPHLEDAANWLMVTATRYWFPSPESKYKECIKELEDYKRELIKGNASFYIRADNLIPLLASYEDLLGACDENLVKQRNPDGSNVGFFKADDYFFYAKGVASAMATILEAIHYDFLPTLESRHGAELIHHALLSCRQASALSPILITNAGLDGIFANHRANMAAPISHARYFIGQLIKTLST